MKKTRYNWKFWLS